MSCVPYSREMGADQLGLTPWKSLKLTLMVLGVALAKVMADV